MPLLRSARPAVLLAVLSAGTGGVVALAYGHGTVQPSGESVTGGSVLHVVAHPDDDLFFMNPDLSRSIRAGSKVTTVYLTSGESDGRNEAHGRHVKDPVRPADRASYAEARQNGIRGAYAQMATGDRTSPWERTSVPTAGGGSAEVDVLVAEPRINLVWLQLREARSIDGENPDSLRGLWNGKTAALGAQLTSGTPVKQPFSYTKDQVVRTVAAVLEQYKPTTIRLQDPTPGLWGESGRLVDHQDHMYGARFIQAATERYAKSTDRPHFSVQNYSGYLNTSLPSTLDPHTAEEKLRYLKTYAWLDHQEWCGSPAGCGDRKTAARPAGYGWSQSIRYSRGDSTSWVAEGASGRLWAFAVLDGRMAYWSHGGPRADWQGPELLPGTGMDTGATAVRLPDGRIAVFGTRTTLGAGPQDYTRGIVYAVQSSPDGAFGPWRTLGTPEASDAEGASAISGPSVAVDRTGRMTVYVRDAKLTLRARAQTAPNGPFGPWQALGGADLQGEPATAIDAEGRRHVYAATSRTVLAWVQQTPDSPLEGPLPTGLPPTTVPLSVSPEGEGVRLFFRRPGSGAVRTALATAGRPAPRVSPLTEVGGGAGYGAVGVAGPLLAGRGGSAGTISTVGMGGTGSRDGSGGAPVWSESRMLYTGAPAGLVEASGAASIAVLGLDADLHVTTAPPAASQPGAPRPRSLWLPAVRR
ncbi:PIG-L family deacetylase [Streptomyces sp. 2P-4]|uniref:PIG-L family deacetylase n=1 Tax=Streptomyces sp. 2P-4 TaxID=2931974 RepID=UPI002541D496|nr:PIG-L family deacetylase [Streptomyces sp. 2P-4]